MLYQSRCARWFCLRALCTVLYQVVVWRFFFMCCVNAEVVRWRQERLHSTGSITILLPSFFVKKVATAENFEEREYAGVVGRPGDI